jgi:histidinol-phosphate aminotransferase
MVGRALGRSSAAAVTVRCGVASDGIAAIAETFFRPALAGLVPYEPGKPAEEVQRELGLPSVVKLASNEGPFGPFPAALAALERAAAELNRYPDGGCFRLRHALAQRHGVRPENVAPGAGADGIVMCLSLACLDPADEVVCGTETFPSYALDALKLGASVRRVPLREYRYDVDGLLEAITPRTKLVYICNPNNPTGAMVPRVELDRFFERVPPHVLTVLDEAYFEYVQEPDYPDGIEEYVKQGRRAVALRTFSKIYGLAGLRIGYAVGPAELVRAIRKVQNAFDVTQPAQEAALASLGDTAEVERRRAVNAAGRAQLAHGLAELGLDPAPATGNFVYVPLGRDARPTFEALLREGVIVRPLHGFGDPNAIRITVGTEGENRLCLEALARVLPRRL